MAVVHWRVAPPPSPGGVLRIALWSIAVLGVGVAVALPDDAAMAALGVIAAAASVLAFIQPVVAVLVLLVAIPFGSRASTTDTTSDPSIGAAELLVALLTAAWLARGVRRREVSVYASALVVAIL